MEGILKKSIIIAAVILSLPFVALATSAQLIRVIDGDTIVAEVSNAKITLRLAGIDCPELKQPGGPEAKAFVEKELASGKFNYKSKRWDKYRRRLATVTTSRGRNLNIRLVQKGHAWAYPKKTTKLIIDEEEKAKEAKLGLWAGSPVPPWEFRAKNKKVAKKSVPKPAQPKIKLYGDSVADIPRDPDGTAVGSAGTFNGRSTKSSADWVPNPVKYTGDSIATPPPSARAAAPKSKPALSLKTAGKNSPIKNSAWDGSVRQVERYLDRNLKDPDSFDAIEWSPVLEVTNGPAPYAVRCKYRARNSFGGMVIENKLFFMTADGVIVEVLAI